MSRQTENAVNLTLTAITIISALLMWRHDCGQALMAASGITFTLGATALFAHFMNGLDS